MLTKEQEKYKFEAEKVQLTDVKNITLGLKSYESNFFPNFKSQTFSSEIKIYLNFNLEFIIKFE